MKRLRKEKERGASLTGYGLIVGLIAILAIAAVSNVGESVTSMFTVTGDKLTEAGGNAGSGSSSGGSSGGSSTGGSSGAPPDETVQLVGLSRQWSDGSFAESCYEYKNPPAGYSYSGPDIGTGVYTIEPSTFGSSFDAYCDMDTDGGGWTVFQYTSFAGNDETEIGDITVLSIPMAMASDKVNALITDSPTRIVRADNINAPTENAEFELQSGLFYRKGTLSTGDIRYRRNGGAWSSIHTLTTGGISNRAGLNTQSCGTCADLIHTNRNSSQGSGNQGAYGLTTGDGTQMQLMIR